MNHIFKPCFIPFLYLPILLFIFSSCNPKVTNPQPDFISPVKQNEQDTPRDTVKKTEYYKPDFIRYTDHIYSPLIKTLLVHKKGFELTMPVIELGTDEAVFVSFDDLEAVKMNYRYTVVQCDALWHPTTLQAMEYLDGFTEGYINDYKFSFNTLQPYTHYSFSFPGENSGITKSGNYLIKIYLPGNEDKPVATCRFMVYENLVSVAGKVKQATLIEDRPYKQEVDFTINKQGYAISDYYNNLKVILMQNGRLDNQISSLKPRMVTGDILDYNYDDINVFDGGNEFRNFDIKSFNYNSERVRKMNHDSAIYHIYLYDDIKRPFKVYISEDDINGRRLIKNEERTDSDIEADYAKVHFTLPYDNPLLDGSLYILGALTNWQFLPEAKMNYDFSKKDYTCTLLLKQGYYNYQYVYVKNSSSSGDETLVEGNHSVTNNEYFIFVYYRQQGEYYDRLVGFKQLFSNK